MTTATRVSAREFTEALLTRRGLLGTGVALTAIIPFGAQMFVKTPEIEAQQLTGNSLYDQLGGVAGIVVVVKDFVGFVAADNRINAFFADTVKNHRVERLIELLVQQIAEASGGPVKYTGLDMKSAHAGMGVTIAAFAALVEDLVMSMDKNGVPNGPKTTLVNALAPMAPDIIERPF